MEKDALWAKVLKSKYCTSQRLNARNKDKLPCSRVWQAMNKGREVFNKGVKWIQGRNSNLSLWHENWAVNGPLRDLIQGPLLEEEECLKVKDVFGPNGWDWSKLLIQIPNAVLMEIKAMPYSFISSNEEDRMVWNGAYRSDFELKSAYNLATKCSEEEEEFSALGFGRMTPSPNSRLSCGNACIIALEWGNVLLNDVLVKLTVALSTKGKPRQSFIDLGIMSRPKSPGADLEFCQAATFMRTFILMRKLLLLQLAFGSVLHVNGTL
ncbi:hypothetical protein SO802_012351 [Lithocarpus litseifolius]|uniref:Uncharacterized protein n=1 Tax=Lithocarpus litseifolius TaxID=425828 RepID=A0AAW2D618_9ROSI